MFWLVEEKEQLEQFSARGFKEVFLEVIPHNFNTHPILDSISLLYVRPINASKGYMLCVDHSEALSLNYDAVIQTLKGIEKIYVRDKKATLQYLPLKTLFDIQPTFNTYIPEQPHVYSFFYQKHRKQKDINRLIPVVKHYEYCETIFRDLKPFNLDCNDDYCQWFNKKSSIVFSAIEANGIKIDKDEFRKHFERDPEDEFVFTSYNLKTLTTRPSNKFGGINYAALNKENGCRKSFIPRNDVFVELDISAYHPTLSGKLVDFDFGDNDIHKAFASMYGVDYKKAKELTFKQLYGGVFKEYEHLEYFKKVKVYTDKLWEAYTENGWIECPISGYQLCEWNLENMNPQKLFNYVLQNMETSLNIEILFRIFKLLKGKKTKLVLYTYDSFLFDVDENELPVLDEIKEVFNKLKLRITEKNGSTYDFR
jgi:hypothetical protein